MKTVIKGFGIGVLLLVAVIGVAMIYVTRSLPKLAPADQSLKIEVTQARVARGNYLVHHVQDCYSCHSIRDWSQFGGPVIAGSEFRGGETLFDDRIGLPGKIPPKNLTPYNLKNYSDGELVRVIRTGVRRDGQPLFPVMPYQNYAVMSQEDLYSVIAYLRTLKEAPNDVPEHELIFPVSVIVHTIPQEAPPFPAPVDPKNTVEYGRYLVRQGSCSNCHSPVDAHHNELKGQYLSGGQEFPLLNIDGDMSALPGAAVRTANLTPDNETGTGKWSKAEFIARFADWRGKSGQAKVQKLKNGEFQSPMPWLYYSGMTDADLGAIYDFLRTVKPVRHEVKKFTPPT